MSSLPEAFWSWTPEKRRDYQDEIKRTMESFGEGGLSSLLDPIGEIGRRRIDPPWEEQGITQQQWYENNLTADQLEDINRPRPTRDIMPRPGGEPFLVSPLRPSPDTRPPPVMPTPNPPVMEPPPPIVSPPPPDIKPLLPPELLPDKTSEYSGQPRPTLINPILPGPLQLPTGQQSSGLTYSRGAAVKPPSLRLKHGGSLTSRVSHLLRILS
jgi:hypothetical protein